MTDQQTNYRFEAVEGDVSDLKHEIWGNGKPGLKADVQEIKIMLGTVIRLLWLFLGAAISVGVAATAATAWVLLKFFVKVGVLQ